MIDFSVLPESPGVYIYRNSMDEIIYVGDEMRDIEASKKVGIPVIAVSWGLNKREALESFKPDQMAHSPKDLPGCIEKIQQ